jgi:hypothetical protein
MVCERLHGRPRRFFSDNSDTYFAWGHVVALGRKISVENDTYALARKHSSLVSVPSRHVGEGEKFTLKDNGQKQICNKLPRSKTS